MLENYKFLVNDEPVETLNQESLSPVFLSNNSLSFFDGNKPVNAKLLHFDPSKKVMQIEVDGEEFEVAIKDQLDIFLEQHGFNNKAEKAIKNIKAPMPGMVLKLMTQEGEQLSSGSKLLILEAMKMENVITLPNDAIIKTILVKPGQAVDKGQVLVELQ